MKPFIYFFILLSIVMPHSLKASDWEEIPAMYKGRVRPLSVYAALLFSDFYESHRIKGNDRERFQNFSPIEILTHMHFLGHNEWDHSPFFYIGKSKLKELLKLRLKQDRFAYSELEKPLFSKHVKVANNEQENELQGLKNLVTMYQKFEGKEIQSNKHYLNEYQKLKSKKNNPQHIAFILESQFPLQERLLNTSHTFACLPSRANPSTWLSLKALKLQVYNPSKDIIEPVGNFTIYPDQDFDRIRHCYEQLEKAFLSEDKEGIIAGKEALGKALKASYKTIEGIPYSHAYNKALSTPTFSQLKTEIHYYTIPYISICVACYCLAVLFLSLALQSYSPFLSKAGLLVLGFAFLLHTAILGLRCYILGRPPVSNMFETVIYVPWISMLIGFVLRMIYRSNIVLIASCLASIALLIVLQVTRLSDHMENVQAVLDSQYWLIVHVLMIVASYGVFILSGILGHFYLLGYYRYRHETDTMRLIFKLILQTMYIGLALLIPGTILGGVWAAQSWGRFWDWDPKESWAFISICVYLLGVHAYKYHKIGRFGLAAGSIIGLMAISFTWYGVNYILGTGLHSYGFGNGGELYFYSFLIMEIFFIFFMARKQMNVA